MSGIERVTDGIWKAMELFQKAREKGELKSTFGLSCMARYIEEDFDTTCL